MVGCGAEPNLSPSASTQLRAELGEGGAACPWTEHPPAPQSILSSPCQWHPVFELSCLKLLPSIDVQQLWWHLRCERSIEGQTLLSQG